jgi:hypothetical protein
MATKIAKWIANDGKEFASNEEAIHHETAVEMLKCVARTLPNEVTAGTTTSGSHAYNFLISAQKAGWEFRAPDRPTSGFL